jgi:hypothetical protein
MVPQDGEHAAPRGRKTDTPAGPRHGVRDSGPAEHDGMMGCAWHEASIGTLGFFNKEGVRLKTIYIDVTAMHRGRPVEFHQVGRATCGGDPSARTPRH